MLGFVAWTGMLLVTLMLITGRAASNGGEAPGWSFWAAIVGYLVGTAAEFAQISDVGGPDGGRPDVQGQDQISDVKHSGPKDELTGVGGPDSGRPTSRPA